MQAKRNFANAWTGLRKMRRARKLPMHKMKMLKMTFAQVDFREHERLESDEKIFSVFRVFRKRNRFFLTLSKIFNEDEPITIEDRKDFLYRHKIALYDVVESCSIKGSSDSSIKDVVPFDIESTLKRYPSIKKIGITGRKAGFLFDKYLKDKVGDIEVIYLPSTSPANAKCKLDTLVKEYSSLFD